MRDLDEVLYEAFRDEMRKVAGLHGALSGAGAGLGLGTLAGGAINAYRGYRGARDQGADVGGALLAGATAAPSGAAVGGLAGAGLGAGAGHMLPQLGARIAATPGLGAPARFAQRQVHGATGWMPHGGGASIGLDASGGAPTSSAAWPRTPRARCRRASTRSGTTRVRAGRC